MPETYGYVRTSCPRASELSGSDPENQGVAQYSSPCGVHRMRFGCGRGAQVVASIEGSLSEAGLLFQNPCS